MAKRKPGTIRMLAGGVFFLAVLVSALAEFGTITAAAFAVAFWGGLILSAWGLAARNRWHREVRLAQMRARELAKAMGKA